MEQDTGKFRKNTKDQYYTKSSVAKKYVDIILQRLPQTASYQWIEPSAGNGTFLKNLPATVDKLGIDLEPKQAGPSLPCSRCWPVPQRWLHRHCG